MQVDTLPTRVGGVKLLLSVLMQKCFESGNSEHKCRIKRMQKTSGMIGHRKTAKTTVRFDALFFHIHFTSTI